MTLVRKQWCVAVNLVIKIRSPWTAENLLSDGWLLLCRDCAIGVSNL
jgi:hypothetical protein